VIDLESSLDYASLRYAHDYHLTPIGHQRVADALRPDLERRMKSP
jgi:hypothetical protein